jgi:hypothetical protein
MYSPGRPAEAGSTIFVALKTLNQFWLLPVKRATKADFV